MPQKSYDIDLYRIPKKSPGELAFTEGEPGQLLKRVSSVTNEDVIPTGSIGLDHILRTGGYLRGRITEIFGKHDVGKTTLALAAVAQAQLSGRRIVYVDTEQKVSDAWMSALNVNPANGMFLTEADGHSVMDSVLRLIKAEKVDLVVIDSLAALIPNGLTIRCDRLGELERLFEVSLPLIAAAAAKAHTCVLLINQMRRDPDQFLPQYTSVGGQIVKHVCSQRLHVSKIRAIKPNPSTVLGGISTVTVQRSVLGSAFGMTQIPITYAKGLDCIYEAILIGKTLGLIPEKTVFTFRNEPMGASETDIYINLLKKPALAAFLVAEVQDLLDGETLASLVTHQPRLERHSSSIAV